jgi:hypothetical protein
MYKKIASLSVLILTTLFFIGCSKDSADSSNKNEKRFLNLNLNGTELSYNGDDDLLVWGFTGENCNPNGKLSLQIVGDIENSLYYAQVNLAHFENLVDFSDTKKNIATTTRVTDTNSYWDWMTDDLNSSFCDLNNDLCIWIEDKSKDNVYLKLKPNTTSKHNITKTEFISEDSTSKIYAIEGNFSATYIKDKSDFPVSGNYRTLIEVLK